MAATETKTGTFYPSEYWKDNTLVGTINSLANALGKGCANTSYCEIYPYDAATESWIRWNFDLSVIPEDATIDSVSCSYKASCKYTSSNYVTSAYARLCTLNTAKTDVSNFRSTSASVRILSGGTWTRDELSGLNLLLAWTSAVDSSNGAIRFYGADLTVTYTYQNGKFMLKIEGNTGLPEGYTRLSHVESTGEQYIDSEYKAISENYRIKCKFTIPGTATVSSTVLCGGGGGDTDILSVMFYSETEFRFYIGSDRVRDFSSPVTFSKGVAYEMECHANNGAFTVILNGATYTGMYLGKINKEYPLAIFSNYTSGSASMFSKVCISEFQIIDSDNLVRDYISSLTNTGSVGMYDRVGKKYYGSESSVAFIAGYEVPVWHDIVRVFKKVNGIWVEQEELANVVDQSKRLVNGGETN